MSPQTQHPRGTVLPSSSFPFVSLGQPTNALVEIKTAAGAIDHWVQGSTLYALVELTFELGV